MIGGMTGSPIGPGALILIVGPSGAGKDTLIDWVRARADGSVSFTRRVVTRAASQHEDHDSMTEAGFLRAEQSGAFALSWRAHGLAYGVPASINQEIGRGAAVICNVSRGVIDGARARYAHCRVVLVTAPKDVLLARLAQRQRASDGNASQRVGRPAPEADTFKPDLVIENVGDPAVGGAQLFDFVARQTKR
jgi:ribose 1,5-bisphosphokinase